MEEASENCLEKARKAEEKARKHTRRPWIGVGMSHNRERRRQDMARKVARFSRKWKAKFSEIIFQNNFEIFRKSPMDRKNGEGPRVLTFPQAVDNAN